MTVFSLVRERKEKRDIFKEKQMRSINRPDERSANFVYKWSGYKCFRFVVTWSLTQLLNSDCSRRAATPA